MRFRTSSSVPSERGGRASLRVLAALSGFALLTAAAVFATPPQWWVDQDVLTGDTASDYAAINAGQLKNLAVRAYVALQSQLPSSAWDTTNGVALTAFVQGLSNTNNYVPVNVGQLKNVAKPFYNVLIENGAAPAYPWSVSSASANDYAIANIGQAKNLFAFDVSALSALQIFVSGGDLQDGALSAALPAPLAVQVLDGNGNPVPNVSVSFSADQGTLSAVSVPTDTSGNAQVLYTTPAADAQATVTATVVRNGQAAQVFFTVYAGTPPAPNVMASLESDGSVSLDLSNLASNATTVIQSSTDGGLTWTNAATLAAGTTHYSLAASAGASSALFKAAQTAPGGTSASSGAGALPSSPARYAVIDLGAGAQPGKLTNSGIVLYSKVVGDGDSYPFDETYRWQMGVSTKLLPPAGWSAPSIVYSIFMYMLDPGPFQTDMAESGLVVGGVGEEVDSATYRTRELTWPAFSGSGTPPTTVAASISGGLPTRWDDDIAGRTLGYYLNSSTDILVATDGTHFWANRTRGWSNFNEVDAYKDGVELGTLNPVNPDGVIIGFDYAPQVSVLQVNNAGESLLNQTYHPYQQTSYTTTYVWDDGAGATQILFTGTGSYIGAASSPAASTWPSNLHLSNVNAANGKSYVAWNNSAGVSWRDTSASAASGNLGAGSIVGINARSATVVVDNAPVLKPAIQIVGKNASGAGVLWEMDPATGSFGSARALDTYLGPGSSWSGMAPSWINDLGVISGKANYSPSGSSAGPSPGSHGVLLVPAELAVDADRNGTIVLASENPSGTDGNAVDRTSVSKPFRFWINDGLDGPSNDSGESDVQDSLAINGKSTDLDSNGKAVSSSNAGRNAITCTRDLQNFARLWMYTKGMDQALQDGTLTIGLEWHSNTGGADDGWQSSDGAPGLTLYRSASNTGNAKYLTDSATASEQVSQNNIPIGTVSKGHPLYLPASTFANLTLYGSKTYFLFEGTSRGTGRLVLTFNTGSSGSYTKVGEGPCVYFDLKDIKEFYERWTAEGNGTTPAASASLSGARLPSGVQPFQYSSTSPGLSEPTDSNGNKYILFVHGWNMPPWERDAFAETAFKRLYWQGYKGKFGAFQWPTTYGGEFDAITGYDNGEYRAWNSAPALEQILVQLRAKYGGVDLLAHSMGNVVAGEALRIAAQNNADGLADTYVASQAAIPVHCYDPAQPLPNGFFNSFRTVLNYHGIPVIALFPIGPTTPNIYNNWMSGNSGAVSTRYNFFNVNDYALSRSVWETDQALKPDDTAGLAPPYGYIGSASDNPPAQYGFYKTSKTTSTPTLVPMDFGNSNDVKNRYEIMAFAAEPRCRALGATSNPAGFSADNLQPMWQDDSSDIGTTAFSSHRWHSAQFRFSNYDQKNYWYILMSRFGLPTNPDP